MDENGDLADCHRILSRSKYYLCQPVNVHKNKVVTKRKYSWSVSVTACLFRLLNSYCKSKNYIPPGIDRMPVELIHAWGDKLRSETHKLIY
jgi:ubiquinone/menaquinone biosynthesis C-methylase UbiE